MERKMTKFVPDVERIRYERRKAMLGNFRNIGLIFIVGAIFGFYRNGWQFDRLTVIYAIAGLCLLGAWRYFKGRWRESLKWPLDQG